MAGRRGNGELFKVLQDEEVLEIGYIHSNVNILSATDLQALGSFPGVM